jgi:hypothetical protein
MDARARAVQTWVDVFTASDDHRVEPPDKRSRLSVARQLNRDPACRRDRLTVRRVVEIERIVVQ